MLKGLFKKKTNVRNENKGVSASYNDAKIFLNSLITDYTSDFDISSKSKILKAYREISILNTVISKSAKAFISANIYLTDNKGNKIEKGQLFETIEEPHLLQSKSEFWESFYINYQLFGATYVLKENLIGYGVNSLLSLPTADVVVKLKKQPNYLRPNNINDIIENYYVDYKNGTATKIDSDLIWELRQVSLSIANNGYISNENPLSAIKKELSLLSVIAEVKQELIGNHGAKGILSPDSKDTNGTIPLTKKEKKQISRDYFETHGLTKGKDKLIISNKAVKFTSISLKLAEMLLNEFQEKAELGIVNNFSFPTSLISDNVTYENKDAGNKELYENKIIPESNIFANSFNKNIAGDNEKLIFDYSHISYLQKDDKKQSEKKLIDTDIILKLNKAVFDKEMTRNSAIFTLEYQGYSNEEATKLISK